ncbi:MAG: ATP synthase F1 subunit gamma [Eubacteriales bacterium]|nr:ATP synthase F1 subunit gamma [Eubacteriales bacterium]
MASMKDIKRRKESVSSTQQITKAMNLVATAKLQKAKQSVLEARPYFNQIHKTISSILSISEGINHPYLEKRDGKKVLYVLISSNRGLAGGYNGNVVKLVLKHIKENANEETMVISAGKKAQDSMRKEGFELLGNYNALIENPNYDEAKKLSEQVIDLFNERRVDEVYVAYTAFHSTLSQEPKIMKLLPLNPEDFRLEEKPSNHAVMNYEPSEEEVLNYIVPKYVKSLLFGTLKESAASEHGARMTAMDSATNNASEMIEKLTLLYNRARQASITQEITEIVSGADAL